jgi:hypothetical protein
MPRRLPADISNFCVSLSPEMKTALFRRAATDDRSAASVVRRALRTYLGEAPTERKPEKPSP